MHKFYKIISFIFLTICFTNCSEMKISQEITPDLFPMYGQAIGIQKTPEQIKADESFIKIATKHNNKSMGAFDLVRFGWQSFTLKNDLKTAIQEFNQAWLLDENNIGTYLGFMALLDPLVKEKYITENQKKTFKETLNKEIQKRDPHKELYNLELALSKAMGKQSKEAWDQFEKTKEAFPNNKHLKAYQILLHFHLDEKEKASELFRATDPEQIVYPYGVGKAFYERLKKTMPEAPKKASS